MRFFLIASVFGAVLLMPSAVSAQERYGDAALGALAGAVVLGPVGLIAGGAIGYTAGPNIARGFGIHKSRRYRASRERRHRTAKRD